MYRIIFLTIFIFLLSCCFSCQNQSKYNLDFRTTDISNIKWESNNIPCLTIDSIELINGKNPLLIKQCPNFSTNPFSNQLIVYWYQPFILPDKNYSDEEKGIIEINNKCSNIYELNLVLFGFDKYENIVYSDSVNINNDSWSKN